MTRAEKLTEIREHPERHRHQDLSELQACCITVHEGTACIDLELMDAHKGTVPQRNPGGCDVIEGPCSCGAWH